MTNPSPVESPRWHSARVALALDVIPARPTSVVRRSYAAPKLDRLFDSGDLLEVLGPAQASYGGTGMP